jgi:hypothetical protein
MLEHNASIALTREKVQHPNIKVFELGVAEVSWKSLLEEFSHE